MEPSFSFVEAYHIGLDSFHFSLSQSLWMRGGYMGTLLDGFRSFIAVDGLSKLICHDVIWLQMKN
jgi:hypothetical protein